MMGGMVCPKEETTVLADSTAWLRQTVPRIKSRVMKCQGRPSNALISRTLSDAGLIAHRARRCGCTTWARGSGSPDLSASR